MASTKPTIVLVHGAWHVPAHWSPFDDALKSTGYDVITPHLPSVIDAGGPEHRTLLTEDAAFLRNDILLPLLSEGKEVVLVLHSYGGLVGSQATEGLGIEERKAKGEKGGVKRAVYVCAFLQGTGKSLLDNYGGGPAPIYKELPDGRYLALPQFAHLFYIPGVSAEKMVNAFQKLTHHSWAAHKENLTVAGHLRIPVTYLHGALDPLVPLEMQNAFVKEARDAGAQVEERTLQTGHTPWLADEDGMLKVIVEAADTGA